MELTRELVIQKHRELWNWLADESEKRKNFVSKGEYFDSHPEIEDRPLKFCWCCEWVAELHGKEMWSLFPSGCEDCPLIWGDYKTCDDIGSLYNMWRLAYDANDLYAYIKLARKIANLPEKIEGNEQK